MERGSPQGGPGHLMQKHWAETQDRDWDFVGCEFEEGMLKDWVEACVDKGRQLLKRWTFGIGRTVPTMQGVLQLLK